MTRFQLFCGHHVHWEQPASSSMFRLACLRKILDKLRLATCELCQFDLVDPETKRPMRKSVTILTISPTLRTTLSSYRCPGTHVHEVIAGNTHVDGQSIRRSTWSESYPRKFARLTVQSLRSFRCTSEVSRGSPTFAVHAAPEPEHRLPKRPRIHLPGSSRFRARSAPELTTVQFFGSINESKRRRLIGKQPEPPSDLTTVVQQVHCEVPRVGKCSITNRSLIEAIQKIWPDKQVCHVLACRGTDRTIGPPLGMVGREAPWRRAIMVRRTDGVFMVESEWERWSELPKAGIIRKSHPCRLNITVFGQDWPPTETTGAQETVSASVRPEVPNSLRLHSGESTAEVPCAGMNVERVTAELDDEQQGKAFKTLSAQERQWIIKIHKNLGHPERSLGPSTTTARLRC